MRQTSVCKFFTQFILKRFIIYTKTDKHDLKIGQSLNILALKDFKFVKTGSRILLKIDSTHPLSLMSIEESKNLNLLGMKLNSLAKSMDTFNETLDKNK